MRSHRDETGQASGYILGVQKLTMSRGVRLRFGEGFVKPKHPEGRWRWSRGRRSGGGLGLSPGPCKGLPPSFPAVSASQVCEQQWPRPINDTLYCNCALCGWCSKVNTTRNELRRQIALSICINSYA